MSKSRVPAKLQATDRPAALFADLTSEASIFEDSFRLIKNMYQGSTRGVIIKNTSRPLIMRRFANIFVQAALQPAQPPVPPPIFFLEICYDSVFSSSTEPNFNIDR